LKVHINNGEEVYTPLAVSKWNNNTMERGIPPPCHIEIGRKARQGGLGPLHHVKIGMKTQWGGRPTPHHVKSGTI